MEKTDFVWNHAKRYNDYASYIRAEFGNRVQKISLDAGFTCPNRDGSKGVGGCIYCNNNSFNPSYSMPQKSVTQQLSDGVAICKQRHSDQKYVAYFQAYSNTYGERQNLIRLYEEALAHPDISGLVLGTRPDCVDEALLDYLAELNQKTYVAVEYGLESTFDETLNFINRCHTHKESEWAIEQTAKRGIPTGAHMIMGLPGESREMMLHHADVLSALPLHSMKMHQLQIVRHTKLARMYKQDPESIKLFEPQEYIDLVIEFLERLRPTMIVERFASESPRDLLIAPIWGIKNYELVHRVEKRMEELDSWQGKQYKG
ncbi:MAG: hypothetical protein RIS47_1825 [Bacteroidota bacterium]|jgi:radical SAM protein (TIGR01212 family)